MGRRPKVTREEVLRAARANFLEAGYEGTTLADIGARIGVSPAALLRHAPTKQALFSAAMGVDNDIGPLPLEFLESYTGNEDPRRVLLEVAEAFLPFIEKMLKEALVRQWICVKAKSKDGFVPPPFAHTARPLPPERNLLFLVEYLRRAGDKGKIKVRDYRAAAFSFIAAIHSYVMIHKVAELFEEPVPLDLYLETLLDIWAKGAIRKGGKH